MGKSTLLGALALHHATYVRVNPKVIVLGGLGGHAKHTLKACAWFISQNKQLQQWWVAQEYGMGRVKSLIHEDAYGVIEISSAGRRVGGRGGSSQEGEAPSLVLVEELHRHEDDGAAVRTLTAKVQKRTVGGHKVRILHVTTAGDRIESPLGRMEQRATGEGSSVEHPRDGLYYTRAVDPDGDLVMHRWSVPDHIEPPAQECSADELDAYLDHVKRANPATFITKRNLRRSWKATAAEPWVFVRQHCNQWTAQHLAAFSRYDWEQCRVPGIEIPAGRDRVFIGLDTATSWDTTAIVPVWQPRDELMVTAGAVILTSAKRGVKRRMGDVIDVLEVMLERWPNMVIVFDRAKGGGLIAEQFEEQHGLIVIDHHQGPPMELASMLLGQIVAGHELRHDGSEQLTAHVCAAAARVSYYNTRWRIEKPRGGAPVDGAVALAMAAHMARSDPLPDIADIHIRQL
jgi:phage terminase large subunit-like protein